MFLPGTHTFEVRTTGEGLQWQIKTPGCNSFSKSPFGSNADPCTGGQADIGVGLTDVQSLGLETRAYPNPFKQKFMLDIRNNGLQAGAEFKVALIDIVGRATEILTTDNLLYGRHEIDLSGLPAGVYFLHLSTAQENRILRIVKE